jgi:hydrogenase nickel incorporation protein HypA/HybF
LRSLDEEAREAIHFLPEAAHAYIRCPKCGSPDFEILSGRGVWLESVRGLK